MKHVYGSLLIVWLVVEQIINSKNNIYTIASLLAAICLFIIKERYKDNVHTSVGYLVFVLAITKYNNSFILLAGITVIDLSYFGKFTAAAVVFLASAALSIFTNEYNYIFHMISALLVGYILGTKDKNENKHISLLDDERRLRYNLERTQNELIKSRKEIEQLTEIRERNRIAHEVHDNIGHSIAGVIFQLEAAARLLRKDLEKSESILRLCSQKLSEALELTRNTVYNIRVIKKTGVAYLEEIINNFKFCKITFEYSGDFSRVTAFHMKILEANLMEALTNAAKYSRAQNIQIRLDVGGKNIRMYYKDDGIGCDNIKESLGLIGMRERVKEAGGIISIDGKDGFLIVCNLPIKGEW
jgi:signal transduction histidine kinase